MLPEINLDFCTKKEQEYLFIKSWGKNSRNWILISVWVSFITFVALLIIGNLVAAVCQLNVFWVSVCYFKHLRYASR